MSAKTFKINESFECLNCGHQVPAADKTCRNHCNQCLWSLHVDGDVPGDRENDCWGLMEPLKIEQSAKGFMIVHRCVKCSEQKRNRVLPDDNLEKIIELQQFA